ncbi:hypothetical protein BGAL_0038g00150 [Botrytis galanthina]|uniref:Uncharacterized protein n=1 Tax=Botrytis galanthina TaxID=278940 RepID=A0A4S8R7D2_9HELO|nr:hypothetical protein BGAL_0038g00150 [Botrytis galanthina]
MRTIYLAANLNSEGQYGLALFCKGCTGVFQLSLFTHTSNTSQAFGAVYFNCDLEVRRAKCDDENRDESLTLRLLAVGLLEFESSLIDSASINPILCKSAECLFFESSLQDTSPSPHTTSELSDALGYSTSALQAIASSSTASSLNLQSMFQQLSREQF